MPSTAPLSGLRRLLAVSLSTLPVLAAAVDVPRDYALPMTTATGATTSGIRLVDSADFTQRVDALPKTTAVSQSHILYGGTPGVDRRPAVLVFAADGGWMKLDLRGGLSAVPQRVSSETQTGAVCESSLLESTRGALPAAGSILYRLPGADATCATGDDVFRRAGIADGEAVAPVTIPIKSLNLYPVYVNGSIAGVFTQEDGNLRRYATDLLSSALLMAAPTLDIVGQSSDGTSFMVVDNVLRRFTPAGGTPLTAMKRTGSGYVFARVVLHGDALYIFENAIRATDPQQTRVFAMKTDGTLWAKAMLNLAKVSTFAGITDGKILYLQGGGTDPVTGEAIPHELRSAPLDTGQFDTDTKRVYRIANGAIDVAAVNGDNVFLNITDNGGVHPVIHADVRADTGTALINGARGSAWLGGKGDPAALDGAPVRDTLLLAKGGPHTKDVVGATLFRFDAATRTSTKLVNLPDTVKPQALTGTGPATLEDFASPHDAWALDLEQGRYTRVTAGNTGTTAIR